MSYFRYRTFSETITGSSGGTSWNITQPLIHCDTEAEQQNYTSRRFTYQYSGAATGISLTPSISWMSVTSGGYDLVFKTTVYKNSSGVPYFTYQVVIEEEYVGEKIPASINKKPFFINNCQGYIPLAARTAGYISCTWYTSGSNDYFQIINDNNFPITVSLMEFSIHDSNGDTMTLQGITNVSSSGATIGLYGTKGVDLVINPNSSANLIWFNSDGYSEAFGYMAVHTDFVGIKDWEEQIE